VTTIWYYRLYVELMLQGLCLAITMRVVRGLDRWGQSIMLRAQRAGMRAVR
jgi:hypothetical protein